MPRRAAAIAQADVARAIVPASRLASEFGFTARHWTRQAAEGKVPGAYQPSGPGGRWVFDLAVFRRWWSTRQREVIEWQGSISAVRRGGADSSVKVRNTGRASEHEIDELLRSALGNG